MGIKVLPYKRGSRSAKALAHELNCKRVRLDGNFRNIGNHLIVNWGNSSAPSFNYSRILNEPICVQEATNKLRFFNRLAGEGLTPSYATTRDGAEGLLASGDVVCRTMLNGHSGAGVVIASSPDELVDAKLYVQYIKKKSEYRFHVFRGEVIDVQEKRRRSKEVREAEGIEVNYQVRNLAGGWIYCRDGVSPPAGLSDMAIRAVSCLGLDFGAVDIIYNKHQDRGYVLEVNTACGLEGSTVELYANKIREVYNEKRY